MTSEERAAIIKHRAAVPRLTPAMVIVFNYLLQRPMHTGFVQKQTHACNPFVAFAKATTTAIRGFADDVFTDWQPCGLTTASTIRQQFARHMQASASSWLHRSSARAGCVWWKPRLTSGIKALPTLDRALLWRQQVFRNTFGVDIPPSLGAELYTQMCDWLDDNCSVSARSPMRSLVAECGMRFDASVLVRSTCRALDIDVSGKLNKDYETIITTAFNANLVQFRSFPWK